MRRFVGSISALVLFALRTHDIGALRVSPPATFHGAMIRVDRIGCLHLFTMNATGELIWRISRKHRPLKVKLGRLITAGIVQGPGPTVRRGPTPAMIVGLLYLERCLSSALYENSSDKHMNRNHPCSLAVMYAKKSSTSAQKSTYKNCRSTPSARRTVRTRISLSMRASVNPNYLCLLFAYANAFTIPSATLSIRIG